MKDYSSIKFIILILILLLFTGCSSLVKGSLLFNPPKNLPTYDGPPLPKNEIALLGQTGKLTVFTEIDGKTISELKEAAGFEKKHSLNLIELLPGEHTIKIYTEIKLKPLGWSKSYWESYNKWEWVLRFVAESDHIYNVVCEFMIEGKDYIAHVAIKEYETEKWVSELVNKNKVEEDNPSKS